MRKFLIPFALVALIPIAILAIALYIIFMPAATGIFLGWLFSKQVTTSPTGVDGESTTDDSWQNQLFNLATISSVVTGIFVSVFWLGYLIDSQVLSVAENAIRAFFVYGGGS